MTLEEYSTTESDFRSILVEKLGDSICLYCVTGSLGREDIITGWSDIDVLLVVKEYKPDLMRFIGDAIKTFANLVKIGVTSYSLQEFNNQLLMDGKTVQSVHMITTGAFRPAILKEGVVLKPINHERAVVVDSFDFARFLIDIKRELVNGAQYDERKVYKLVHTAIKILLREKGVDIAGYDKVLAAAPEYLEDFRIRLATPLQIISSPDKKVDRYNEYILFLKWVQDHVQGLF